ncbi:MAG: DUF2199 domain-containing protein [Propionicimonas sp.]|nr:DUF2199 domain-containing protein [Propionicimonas sp.]
MFSATGSGTPQPCPVCNQTHLEVADLLGASAPDAWLAVTPGERLEAELTPDVCIMTDHGRTRHFIRGHIQLPVHDFTSEVFVWSVWVELDAEAMERVSRSWSNPNRAAIPPIEGRLANELPYEKATRGLTITVHTRDPGLAPLLMVGEEHALAIEQREGIDLHRVAELEELLRR